MKAGVASDAYWFVRRSAPTELLFAPVKELPAFLWVPAGTTAASVRDGLADYTLLVPAQENPAGFTIHDTYTYRSGVRKADLPRVARGFMGRAGRMQVTNPYDGSVVTAWGHDLAR